MAAKILLLLLGFLPAAFATHAQAQSLDSMVGMVSTVGSRVTSNGSISGCSLEFKAIVKDTVYHQGQYSAVIGSISLLANGKGGASYLLKAVVNDLVLGAQGINFVPNAPQSIQLETMSGKSTANIKSLSKPAETAGGLLKAFALTDDMVSVVAEMANDNQITLLFNRSEGGMDVRVPLDFTVVDTGPDNQRQRSYEQISTYNNCILELLRSVTGD